MAQVWALLLRRVVDDSVLAVRIAAVEALAAIADPDMMADGGARCTVCVCVYVCACVCVRARACYPSLHLPLPSPFSLFIFPLQDHAHQSLAHVLCAFATLCVPATPTRQGKQRRHAPKLAPCSA